MMAGVIFSFPVRVRVGAFMHCNFFSDFEGSEKQCTTEEGVLQEIISEAIFKQLYLCVI